MFSSSQFNLFSILDQLLTQVATAYIFLVAIALSICLIQSSVAIYLNETQVSNEFYQEVKQAFLVEDTRPKIDFNQMTIRSLREYIREHSLQTLVREQSGKTCSRCNSQELKSVLNNYQSNTLK